MGIGVLLALASPAMGQRIELAGVAGYNAPIDQEDTSDDILVGARARFPVGPFLKLEPAITWHDMDREPYRSRGVIQEVAKWHIVSTTLNLTVGRDFGRPGFHPYLTAGAGYYFLRKEEAEDQDRLGINAGAGLMVLMRPDVSLDLSGRAERISLESGGSRGQVNVRVGIHYHLGELR
jgi:hypothetical protein